MNKTIEELLKKAEDEMKNAEELKEEYKDEKEKELSYPSAAQYLRNNRKLQEASYHVLKANYYTNLALIKSLAKEEK